MLNAQQRKQVKNDVLSAYKERYPEWSEIKVTEIVENTYFGTMVSISASEYPDGEICVHTKKGVIIFETTPELVRYLDMRAKQVISLRDWLTMIVVIFVLALFATTVFYFEKPESISLIVTAMAGVIGTYAGINIKSTLQTDA